MNLNYLRNREDKIAYISKEEALIAISEEREKGIFEAIHVCNSDYQQVIQQMCNDFISLKRINKSDVVRILSSYADINLGEDINPYLEDEEDNGK